MSRLLGDIYWILPPTGTNVLTSNSFAWQTIERQACRNNWTQKSVVEVNNPKPDRCFLGTNKYKMVEPTRYLGFKWDK